MATINEISYIRSKVTTYFVDIGMTIEEAVEKMKNMTDEEICRIYDNEPYFDENGF